MFRPELIVYVAGADPYYGDQLGGLSLTLDGLRERDRLVIWSALQKGVPVVIVLAGGYAQSVEDTVTIHANTAEVAKELYWRSGIPQGKGRLGGSVSRPGPAAQKRQTRRRRLPPPGRVVLI